MKGAIFDMDGVLFDTERVYQEIWKEIALERGVELPAFFPQLISGSSGDQSSRVLKKYYQVEDPGLIGEECIEKMKRRLSKEVPVKPGAAEILDYLRSLGIKTAVASGSVKEQIQSNLRLSGLEEKFDVIVSGSELLYGKPNPHIFLYAAEQLGCDAAECYVFEDSQNGILAASAAGCRAILIPDIVDPSEDIKRLSSYIAVDLLEAMSLIKKELEIS